MNKKKQLILAAVVLALAAAGLFYMSVQDKRDPVVLNRERTEETTTEAPAPEFSDAYNLHVVFEDMSGYELKETQKNKKMTAYIYKFTSEDGNQEKDVFADFCKELSQNGYIEVSQIADGTGYRNQYELLYEDIHFMVYTESSPDKIVLSVVDYNEET